MADPKNKKLRYQPSKTLKSGIVFDAELSPRLVTPDFPGQGRGVLQYVWQASGNQSFRISDEDHDVILVCGVDDEGLLRAAEALIDKGKR